MTTKHDDGGPAFPAQSDGEWQYTGMTLWDFYAAAAVTGFMSADVDDLHGIDRIAHISALVADAMLAERRKRGIGT